MTSQVSRLISTGFGRWCGRGQDPWKIENESFGVDGSSHVTSGSLRTCYAEGVPGGGEVEMALVSGNGRRVWRLFPALPAPSSDYNTAIPGACATFTSRAWSVVYLRLAIYRSMGCRA